MLLTRIKTALILLAIGLTVIFLGGWFYFAFIAIILLLAGKEFTQIYHKGGYSPNLIIISISIFCLALFRYLYKFENSDFLLVVIFLVSFTFHTLNFESGNQKSPIDLALTIFAIFYFGWAGSYFISIMELPGGRWWLLLSIIIISFADSGAYFFGSKFGKHYMSPRTSPKKTWEGYFGGVFIGILGAILVGIFFNRFNSAINLSNGLILGIILSITSPLGDLAESMIKRQFNIKDSGTLLPGHGGAMDRIDTWVWGVCLSYYLIYWFF